MTIRAVVFDIGGVLELDVIELVDHGLDARWEQRLGSSITAWNQSGERGLWGNVLRRRCIRGCVSAWA